MGKRGKEERDHLARKVQAAINAGDKTVVQIAEEFGVSPRTVRRYKKTGLILREKLENPLDAIRLFRYTENELGECKAEVRGIIAEQKALKKQWDRYYRERKRNANRPGHPTFPRPSSEYKPHLVLKATELLALFEKTRVIIGQEIGVVPKAGLLPMGTAPPPELSGGGNGSGEDDIQSRILSLPPTEQKEVTTVVREVWQKLKILRNTN